MCAAECVVSAFVGTHIGMDSDMLIAMSGLMGLAAAVLTGALWGSPVATASVRWFMH